MMPARGRGSAHPERRAWLVLAVFMALTVLVYIPALRGGFVFDDGYYFLDNADVHVATLALGDWVRAATSQAGTNQFRALGMLSFAANYYFTGLDPYWLKATNVAIHLGNGMLLFLALRALFRLRRGVRSNKAELDPSGDALIAALIAGAWLLLPINLTAVAYVAQRLEALANLFVLLGLWLYLRFRLRVHNGTASGGGLWASLIACTLLGLAAKESAALLPLYTACVEFAVTGFRDRSGRYCRAAVQAHVVLLLLPFVAGVLWLSTWAFSGVTNFRQFSMLQRLYTETRVLIDYVHWTLLPNLDALTFYHDDIAVSEGLLQPPTTLLAIATLLAAAGVALWQRRRRPLFCLGVLWYFAGHSMTATIVPLELVFEHRNYFPSIGLLLALAALLALEPVVRARMVAAAAASCLFLLFTFTTYLRATEWSHPLRLAYSEALKRPASARAQYMLAQTLINGAHDDDSPLLQQSMTILRRNASQDRQGIASLQALIYLAARLHQPIEHVWWERIAQELRERTPTQTDIDAVIFLFRCQERGDCPKQVPELLDAFTAALTKSQGNVNLMAAYGEFALLELGDTALAERMYRGTVAARPQVAVYHANLVEFLIFTAQFDAAKQELDQLRGMNHLGALDGMIGKLEKSLQEASGENPSRTPPQEPGNP